jgi:LysM repeat protein
MGEPMEPKRKRNPYISYHKIKYGETLPMIAHVYKTNVERIYKLNRKDQFYVGQVIKVPNNQ